MKLQTEQLEATKRKLTIVAELADLDDLRPKVVEQLGRGVKVAGFRAGKAPLNLLEKQLDPQLVQAEFLEQAVNRLYVEAIQQTGLRPVAQPQISITKFVPFTTLEFTAEFEAVGDINLTDYKKIKLAAPKPEPVTDKEVNDVIATLRGRAGEKKTVKRASKNGDQVTFDFFGSDAATKEPISGADGKDYPLIIGSDTFIPGFETNLEGLQAGQEKDFPITFPADYGVKALQNKKANFHVTVSKVEEIVEPKLDDAFAATVGSFKTVVELKADIKKQLQAEKQQRAETEYQNQLIQAIADKSEVAVPSSLVDEEIERMETEEKRNIAYRGQTWQEHLDSEGLTEEAHREQKREAAENRVKSGLVLSQISEVEGIDVSLEELEVRIQLLKGQYPDPAMQAEIDKLENRRDIHSRMLTEKTIDTLRNYATVPVSAKK